MQLVSLGQRGLQFASIAATKVLSRLKSGAGGECTGPIVLQRIMSFSASANGSTRPTPPQAERSAAGFHINIGSVHTSIVPLSLMTANRLPSGENLTCAQRVDAAKASSVLPLSVS
jgi:hypothetical protein